MFMLFLLLLFVVMSQTETCLLFVIVFEGDTTPKSTHA